MLPVLVAPTVPEIIGYLSTALTGIIDAATLVVMATSGFAVMLARRFGPGVIKALK
jgi:hypothetical protein